MPPDLTVGAGTAASAAAPPADAARPLASASITSSARGWAPRRGAGLERAIVIAKPNQRARRSRRSTLLRRAIGLAGEWGRTAGEAAPGGGGGRRAGARGSGAAGGLEPGRAIPRSRRWRVRARERRLRAPRLL